MNKLTCLKIPVLIGMPILLSSQSMARPRTTPEELTAPSQTSDAALGLLNMALHGAHHVPLQMQHGIQDYWVTSDYASNDHYDSEMYLIEAGLVKSLMGDQLLVGFGVGQSWMNQDLQFNGDSDLDGQYLLTELSYRAKDSDFVYSFTGAYGMWDADIQRGYIGGLSSGSTDIDTLALRLRVDWVDAANIGGFSISPLLEYSYFYTDMDGYTETTGVSPLTFFDQKEPSHQLRYGLAATREVFSGKGLLRLRAEGVYRMDGEPSRTVGTFGFGSFSASGPDIRQNWALLGADLDYELSENTTLTVGVMTATSGDDPTIGLSLGVRAAY